VNLSWSGGVDLDLYVTDPGHERSTSPTREAAPEERSNTTSRIRSVSATRSAFTIRRPSREPIDQKDGASAHTIRFDQKGRAWYTLAVSNQVAMIDPRTGEQRTIRLPGKTWGQSLAARVTPFLLRFGGWLPQPETMSPDMMLPVP